MSQTYHLDAEEKAILDAYNAGKLKRSKTVKADIEILTQAAKNYSEPKSISITLRMSPTDVSRLKIRAASRGLKYQSLLTTLTRQFLDEEIEVKL